MVRPEIRLPRVVSIRVWPVRSYSQYRTRQSFKLQLASFVVETPHLLDIYIYMYIYICRSLHGGATGRAAADFRGKTLQLSPGKIARQGRRSPRLSGGETSGVSQSVLYIQFSFRRVWRDRPMGARESGKRTRPRLLRESLHNF